MSADSPELVWKTANLAVEAGNWAAAEYNRSRATVFAEVAERKAEEAERIANRLLQYYAREDPKDDVLARMEPIWADCDRARHAARAAHVVAGWTGTRTGVPRLPHVETKGETQ